ncbi:hypothetical protein TcasGA2_TC002440 [Tribolium castaneum]|uniref:Uncharacterized protein n=1 Tax=Tribolium castaneum TaxID=7070 RepID=D6WIE0_TRICA|nr:hypothetical protein TcasGA2_TC002440 [Tribolium castaneum]
MLKYVKVAAVAAVVLSSLLMTAYAQGQGQQQGQQGQGQ